MMVSRTEGAETRRYWRFHLRILLSVTFILCYPAEAPRPAAKNLYRVNLENVSNLIAQVATNDNIIYFFLVLDTFHVSTRRTRVVMVI